MPVAYKVVKRLYETRDAEFNHVEWRLGVLFTANPFDALQVGNTIYDTKSQGTEQGVKGYRTFNIQKEYYTVILNPGEIKTLLLNEYVEKVEIKRYQLFAWPHKKSLGNMNVVFANDGTVDAFWIGEFDKIAQVRDAIETVRDEYKEVSFIDVSKGHGMFINAFKYWDKDGVSPSV